MSIYLYTYIYIYIYILGYPVVSTRVRAGAIVTLPSNDRDPHPTPTRPAHTRDIPVSPARPSLHSPPGYYDFGVGSIGGSSKFSSPGHHGNIHGGNFNNNNNNMNNDVHVNHASAQDSGTLNNNSYMRPARLGMGHRSSNSRFYI